MNKYGVLGGCADCPPNSYSSPGSITLTDCKCNAGFSNEAANTSVCSEMAILPQNSSSGNGVTSGLSGINVNRGV